MSKGKDLVEVRVRREQDWALAAFHARLSWGAMRLAAMRPPEQGGLGYPLSESALRGLVQAARREAGDLTMTREERVERQGIEIDARARAARFDLERAYASLAAPAPELADFYDPAEYLVAVKAYGALMEAAQKAADIADRRLAAAMKDERDLHGLNAPTRIEAEVTTRDAVMDDLNAALVALGQEPVKVE